MVSYEFRRRIRNQIRAVKKQIEENLKQSVVTEERDEVVVRETVRQDSRPRSPVRKVSEAATSPTRRNSSRTQTQSSTTSSSSMRQSSTIQRMTTRDETTEKRSVSPAKSAKVTTVTTTTTRNERVPQGDDKPIWTQKNILKKASENTRTMNTTRKVVDQKAFSRPKTTPVVSQVKDATVTDCCVTSSYGIGPTDDNGKPIFGLRALKKKKNEGATETVTGSIVQESWSSENGGPATGERTVTMYSNDENQLKDFNGKRIKDNSIDRNMIAVRKSQKIVEGQVEPMITTTLSSNKTNNTLTRRGSVKEMSEKFIQKETESSTKVNGSSYPKAGLILRTQSTRSSSTDGGDNDVEYRTKSGRTVTQRRTTTTEKYVVDEGEDDEVSDDQGDDRRTSAITSTTRTSTRSFLNSAGEKVTDVNDVLDRMRNADNGK